MNSSISRLSMQSERIQEKRMDARLESQARVEHAQQQDLQALKRLDHENRKRADPAAEKGRHVDRMA